MNALKSFFNSLKRETSGKKYLPFVDGMRFLAIMPVVLLHANERLLKYNINESSLAFWESETSYLISRGAIGVMIFFALSGFILSIPFANKKAFSYRRYLGKRLTRLEPPYIFWMSCFGLIYLFQSNIGLDQFMGHFLASLTYTHNAIYQEFSIINPVAWSLEVEIQYYLLAPFIGLVYFKQSNIGFRRSALIIFIFTFITYEYMLGWQYLPIRASLLGQLHLFLVGLLMADIYVNAKAWCSSKHYAWDILAPLSLITMAFTWTEEYGKTLLFTLALAGLFLAALKGQLFPKLLSLKGISIIGGMCYTIYLTHLPLLELLGSLTANFWQSSVYIVRLSKFLIISLPTILLSSMIFYKVIEQPFMKQQALKRLMERFKIRKSVKAIN